MSIFITAAIISCVGKFVKRRFEILRHDCPPYFYPLKFCLTLLPPHITRKENPMEQIPDDPIIAAMLRTGWPPWMLTAGADDDGLDQD